MYGIVEHTVPTCVCLYLEEENQTFFHFYDYDKRIGIYNSRGRERVRVGLCSR